MELNKRRWVPMSGQFTKGHILYLGRLPIAQIIARAARGEGAEDVFVTACTLPGADVLTKLPSQYNSLDAAKRAIEIKVDRWIKDADEDLDDVEPEIPS